MEEQQEQNSVTFRVVKQLSKRQLEDLIQGTGILVQVLEQSSNYMLLKLSSVFRLGPFLKRLFKIIICKIEKQKVSLVKINWDTVGEVVGSINIIKLQGNRNLFKQFVFQVSLHKKLVHQEFQFLERNNFSISLNHKILYNSEISGYREQKRLVQQLEGDRQFKLFKQQKASIQQIVIFVDNFL